ncbi:MAG: DUF4124 domain-containing protein [Gammaproteobacteria bacterium]|jgi:hypothetical protein|nr:DUF4124 domain-containing protein [Gammaproteobacteria bacterium]
MKHLHCYHLHCYRVVLRFTAMLLLVALGTNLAQAGSIYKWLDDTGQLHYSHTVPPEVVRMEYQRLNSQAVVMEHIESADVPNMLAEIELTQDQKSRRITKRLLLATYHSVDDIANERDQALSYLNKEQQINDRYLKLLNDRLREARYMYQHLSDNQGLAYSTMQATIDSLTASIRQQQQQLATLDNKRNLVQRQYQIEVSRYNEALMLSETNQLELRMPAMDYKNQ